jgi:thiamine pyrophosphate-dependent acetolactate synthase large subunit-like protein
MDVTSIKNQLHQLIDETNDEQLLQDLIHTIEQNQPGKDWWSEVPEGRKQRILESEEQYKKGEIISNEEVMQKIQQWLQK